MQAYEFHTIVRDGVIQVPTNLVDKELSHVRVILLSDAITNSTEPQNKSTSRKGWAKAANEISRSGNEESLFPDFFEDEDLSWWQWEQK